MPNKLEKYYESDTEALKFCAYVIIITKAELVVNTGGNSWFEQLIYETHGVKKWGGKSCFHESVIRSIDLGCKNSFLWHYTETLYILPGEVKIRDNLDKSSQKFLFM